MDAPHDSSVINPNNDPICPEEEFIHDFPHIDIYDLADRNYCDYNANTCTCTKKCYQHIPKRIRTNR